MNSFKINLEEAKDSLRRGESPLAAREELERELERECIASPGKMIHVAFDRQELNRMAMTSRSCLNSSGNAICKKHGSFRRAYQINKLLIQGMAEQQVSAAREVINQKILSELKQIQ